MEEEKRLKISVCPAENVNDNDDDDDDDIINNEDSGD